MKNLSFLCAGVLTTCLALANTACSDNTADRTNPVTSESTRSETYNAASVNGTNSSVTGMNPGVSGTNSSVNGTNSSLTSSSSSIGNGSGEASSEYMLDPTGSGTGE